MSKRLALEKVGRARVAYQLQSDGWRVGEALDDGYDLLAHHPERGVTCLIELKAMDIRNRGRGSNLTAPVSATERRTCTHIIVYVEPNGWYFIARKSEVLTPKGNVFAALHQHGGLRTLKSGSKSFARFKDAWSELFR